MEMKETRLVSVAGEIWVLLCKSPLGMASQCQWIWLKNACLATTSYDNDGWMVAATNVNYFGEPQWKNLQIYPSVK